MRTPGVTFPLMAAALLVLVCAGVADAQIVAGGPIYCSTGYNNTCTLPKMKEEKMMCPDYNCTEAVCCTLFRKCQTFYDKAMSTDGVSCRAGFAARADADSYVCPATGCDDTHCCSAKPPTPDAACTDAFKGTCPTGSVINKNQKCDPGEEDHCSVGKCCELQCMQDSCSKLSDDPLVDCKVDDKAVCNAKCTWNKDTTPAQLDDCVTCILANAGDKANTCYDCFKCYTTEVGVDNGATKLVWGSVRKPGDQAVLEKASSDTKHFVEVDVTMPYTVEQFNTPVVTTSFKNAVATTAGTVPDNVVVVSVTSARRQSSSSVVVKTTILAKDAAAVTTMQSTLGSGDALKTKLNTALKSEGLKESTGVTAPVTGTSAAARSMPSTAQMLIAALSLIVFARM